MPMTARKLSQQTQFGLGSRSAMQLQAGKREEDLNFFQLWISMSFLV